MRFPFFAYKQINKALWAYHVRLSISLQVIPFNDLRSAPNSQRRSSQILESSIFNLVLKHPSCLFTSTTDSLDILLEGSIPAFIFLIFAYQVFIFYGLVRRNA